MNTFENNKKINYQKIYSVEEKMSLHNIGLQKIIIIKV